MRKEFFEFEPEGKFILSGNHRPQIRGQDEGIWRRVLLVPFTISLPKAERIADLDRKLIEHEASGILNWMLDGLRMFYDNGLSVPQTVGVATDGYREDSDPIGRFTADCVVANKNTAIPARELFQAYVTWCKANAEKPWTQKSFGTALTERGWVRKSGSGGYIQYCGYELADRHNTTS